MADNPLRTPEEFSSSARVYSVASHVFRLTSLPRFRFLQPIRIHRVSVPRQLGCKGQELLVLCIKPPEPEDLMTHTAHLTPSDSENWVFFSILKTFGEVSDASRGVSDEDDDDEKDDDNDEDEDDEKDDDNDEDEDDEKDDDNDEDEDDEKDDDNDEDEDDEKDDDNDEDEDDEKDDDNDEDEDDEKDDDNDEDEDDD
ncbi:hypothetical protein KOW79_021021 [Hemibagrus wyckioides]|uniref:Uncharacterized protein n=1 Tax=Hemibagrus wyckioides TaxID=337641 RepID=A0A9D3N7Y1_9TELE|nr:hypothetical protein KOW79_021021 [Hemibagrus wyckioides]